MLDSELRFIRQLGFTTPSPDHQLYEALMLQPRIVGSVVVIGILLQSAWPFLALSAVMLWATFLPTQHLFDGFYNRVVARPRGLPRLGIAPAPRRFAQGMAATFALLVGAALLADATYIAWALQAFFITGVSTVVFGRVCPPAELYQRLERRRAVA
jgi:hypothetical protein